MEQEKPKCRTCTSEATCLGRYEVCEGPEEYGCDTCCGHGNEDGYCNRLPWAPELE